tara:strand:+ start:4276 stop:5253 length:978 start_codon:yes stop_codon:yes gene_type:complete
MRVLVTGADGFIGSHLVELLYQQGYEITALAQYNSFGNMGWLSSIKCKENIAMVSGDIRDLDFCQSIMKEIDIVYHLAALIAIPFSYIAPQSYLETNINGTMNVCIAAKNNKVKRVINVSTSEVYGTANYVPINEEHPLQPQSPYSASKIAAESIAMSFYNSYELPITTVRPFNTYGPRQSARAIIPTIISQINHNIKEIKLGDINPTRDFNYVEDTCRGIILVSKEDKLIGRVVNIGSNTENSIETIVNLIQKIMNKNIKILTDKKRIRPKNSEVFRLNCDYSLLKSLTNYEPLIEIEVGLEKTIEWFIKPENKIYYSAEKYNI